MTVAFLFGSPALAADWRYASDSTGTTVGRSADFIDAESLRMTSGQATFWIFTVYEHEAAQMDNVRALYRANCETHSFVTLQTIFYLADRSVHTGGYEAERYAAPGTVMYTDIDIACGIRPMDITSISNPYAVARGAFASTPH